MNPANIDDFYYNAAEVLCRLYAGFPVRNLLLVEEISGPIRWDMTGMPDRKSKATFEAIIWLSDHGLFDFRSVEPRDLGVEGAVLTQHAFVLLTGPMRWGEGEVISRIEGLQTARRNRTYSDLGTIVKDLLRANCQWGAPLVIPTLNPSASMAVVEDLPADDGVN